MTVKLKNNVVGYLAAPLTSTATGISLQSGNGGNFPALGAGEYFYATVVSPSNTLEVVKVTARANDSLTVIRAQDDTVAAEFMVGSRVEMRVNAKSVLDLVGSATAGTVPFTPAGGISSTNVQDAIEEVDAAFSSITAATVSFTPTGTVTATNVQDAIVQASAGGGGGTAASVSFTPAQGIAATNVQAALEEVKTDLSASSGTTTIGYTRGGAGSITRTLQQRLSDNWISVKDFGAVGDYVADDTAAIQAAIDSTTGNTIYFPPGTYKISAPINIKRGIRLMGVGPYDDSNNNSIIRLANGANCTMVQTPAATVPAASTHFMAIEGLGFHGNGLNQTIESTAIKFFGVFIGGYIRNVAIYEAYGAALELAYGQDVQLDHVWILGAISPSGKYALGLNVGGGYGGLINLDHVYVEGNRNKKNGDPYNVQADRGNAILANKLVSLNMHDVRVEGARRLIDIDGCLSVRITNGHCNFVGLDSDTDSAFVRFINDVPKSVSIGTLYIENPSTNMYPVQKAVGLNSDWIANQKSYQYYSSGYSSLFDPNLGYQVQAPTVFSNFAAIERVGTPLPVSLKFFNAPNGGRTTASYINDNANLIYFGTNFAQPSNTNKDYIKFFTYGSPYDHIELSGGPVHLSATRTNAQDIPDGSLWQSTSAYEGGAGLVWQRIFGNNGGGDMVVSARRGSGVPTVNAGFIGQMWIDVTASPRQAYIAVNVGTGPTDWRLIT